MATTKNIVENYARKNNITLSKNYNAICAAIEKNSGYCPCRSVKNEKTLCPCDAMRKTGKCICNLFIEDNIR